MEVADRLYLDTNIFIQLGEVKGEITHLLTALADSQRPNSEIFLCTSELTLAELVVLPYRAGDELLLQTYDNWMVSGGAFAVSPVDRPVLWGAAVIRAQYKSLKLPDAIHLSTAIRMKCSHFLTADYGIPSSVSVRSRQNEVDVGPAKLAVIRPDVTTLSQLLQDRTTT